MSGLITLLGLVLVYLALVGFIELYGRYLLRRDAKERVKYSLQLKKERENSENYY
jgi:hypothetical protein